MFDSSSSDEDDGAPPACKKSAPSVLAATNYNAGIAPNLIAQQTAPKQQKTTAFGNSADQPNKPEAARQPAQTVAIIDSVSAVPSGDQQDSTPAAKQKKKPRLMPAKRSHPPVKRKHYASENSSTQTSRDSQPPGKLPVMTIMHSFIYLLKSVLLSGTAARTKENETEQRRRCQA